MPVTGVLLGVGVTVGVSLDMSVGVSLGVYVNVGVALDVDVGVAEATIGFSGGGTTGSAWSTSSRFPFGSAPTVSALHSAKFAASISGRALSGCTAIAMRRLVV